MAKSRVGVHLVGSIRLPDEPEDPLSEPPSAKKVFQTISQALPGRLTRIPDGETGERHYFVRWQYRAFLDSPWLLNDFMRQSGLVPGDCAIPADMNVKLRSTGYDEHAIDSYSSFAKLQRQGKIDPSARFQVSLPTPLNVLLVHVRPEFQALAEPLYEEMLFTTIRNIQDKIPPEKLAFQIDCAVELAVLEGVMGPGNIFKPWFEPTIKVIVDRIERVTKHVHRDAQLGFHLCYGDMNHQHFHEPTDTSRLVELSNMITERVVAHSVDFIHIPVPKQRTDDSYFVPLKKLMTQAQTELYLGLVHAHDLDGTRRRIEAAERIVPRFGISTECGWGRTPVQDIESILEILEELSSPVLE